MYTIHIFTVCEALSWKHYFWIIRNFSVKVFSLCKKGKGRLLMNVLKLFWCFVLRTRKLFTVWVWTGLHWARRLGPADIKQWRSWLRGFPAYLTAVSEVEGEAGWGWWCWRQTRLSVNIIILSPDLTWPDQTTGLFVRIWVIHCAPSSRPWLPLQPGVDEWRGDGRHAGQHEGEDWWERQTSLTKPPAGCSGLRLHLGLRHHWRGRDILPAGSETGRAVCRYDQQWGRTGLMFCRRRLTKLPHSPLHWRPSRL